VLVDEVLGDTLGDAFGIMGVERFKITKDGEASDMFLMSGNGQDEFSQNLRMDS
jgi:hypothetical protein